MTVAMTVVTNMLYDSNSNTNRNNNNHNRHIINDAALFGCCCVMHYMSRGSYAMCDV
jgi:hypothetical protein